jgi:hypothetical protein
MIKNFPTHGLTTWMTVQTFYARLNFSSRNLLDSAAGGTFMSLTLGAATKLLDNMMVNYSEWHTERAPQGKKVNYVEKTSSLSDKIDAIMLMIFNDRTHVDPNNVHLASLVAQESKTKRVLSLPIFVQASAGKSHFGSRSITLVRLVVSSCSHKKNYTSRKAPAASIVQVRIQTGSCQNQQFLVNRLDWSQLSMNSSSSRQRSGQKKLRVKQCKEFRIQRPGT